MSWTGSSIVVGSLMALSATVAAAQTADQLKCYRVHDPLALRGVVDLNSPELGLEPGCRIAKPFLFCVPVTNTVVEAHDRSGPIQPIPLGGPDPGDRICYKIKCTGTVPAPQEVTDQFGTRTVQPDRAYTLCAPAVRGGPPPTPFTGAPTCEDPTAAASFILDCHTAAGYEVTSKLGPPPQPGAPVLRVIGIYRGYPSSEATVNVKRAERTVLVLSAYESVHWTVNVAPGAVLERVILIGALAQTATVPAGVPVENHSPDPDAPCGVAWPSSGGGCDTDALIAEAEQLTGLCLTSFHGCYEANEFSIPAGDVGSPGGAFLE